MYQKEILSNYRELENYMDEKITTVARFRDAAFICSYDLRVGIERAIKATELYSY